MLRRGRDLADPDAYAAERGACLRCAVCLIGPEEVTKVIVLWSAYVPRPGLVLITKPRPTVFECARVTLTLHPRSFSTALATPEGVFVSSDLGTTGC